MQAFHINTNIPIKYVDTLAATEASNEVIWHQNNDAQQIPCMLKTVPPRMLWASNVVMLMLNYKVTMLQH